MKIRIGTRGSDLALWQAHTVAGWLCAADGVEVEIIVMKTRGDTIDDVPLSTVAGKDFFTAEIEKALLDGSVDVAVHSHKDLATENPPGLAVVGVPTRGPDREHLLVRPGAWCPNGLFLPLVRGAKVGTSAPRRREQLLALRPDLVVEDLRGNVPTRVARLREERYDAIVLAAAGLERLALELGDLETRLLDRELFVPAPAQGALAIQVRATDTATRALVEQRMHDASTERAIRAERRVLSAAGGGCSLPLGANVTETAQGYRLRAFLGADHPSPGAPARWVDVTAATPEAAAERALEVLREGRPTGVGPLAGHCIGVAGSGNESGLVRRLRTLGAEVLIERVLDFRELDASPLARSVAALRSGDAIALTSPRAAAPLARCEAPPAGVTIAAVGPTTAAAMTSLGIAVDVVGTGGALELARELPVEAGRTVVFPSAEDPRPDLTEGLQARGVRVDRVPVYATHPIPGATGHPRALQRVFTSPSAVRALLAWELKQGPGRGSRLALGRATWDALREHDLVTGEPPAGSGPETVIEALAGRVRTLS